MGILGLLFLAFCLQTHSQLLFSKPILSMQIAPAVAPKVKHRLSWRLQSPNRGSQNNLFKTSSLCAGGLTHGESLTDLCGLCTATQHSSSGAIGSCSA